MTPKPTGPACGNNPNYRLSDGDRQAVEAFKAYLADRAALRDLITKALATADGWQFPDGRDLHDLPDRELVQYRDGAAAVLAVLPEPFAEMERQRDRHKASLRRADEINNKLMAEVQRYAAGTERPVLWSVYNAMHQRAVEAEAALKTLAVAFEGFGRLLAFSSRDWGQYAPDAWLYAVILGWDCEETEHDGTCTHGAMEEMAQRHGWDAATVAKARRYRAAVRALVEAHQDGAQS